MVLGTSRLCGWFNPFINPRNLKEAQRLTVATGIDHTEALNRAAEFKKNGGRPAHTNAPGKK